MSDHPQQSYFCVCAPVPGMPTGNRFPYGVCGPFLDEKEGQEALKELQAVMPRRDLKLMRCCDFFDAPDSHLANDQLIARTKLVSLLTANKR